MAIQAWRYDMEGVTGKIIPIYMLDTDLPQNHEEDRKLTDHLYGGDSNYRLRQEAVLGIGGALILEELGYHPAVYHMNEGHAALLTVALMESSSLAVRDSSDITDRMWPPSASIASLQPTLRFQPAMTASRWSRPGASWAMTAPRVLERLGCCHEGLLNMTYIALRFSRFVNGVAMQHGIVSRLMFPEYAIDAITNGVHAVTWTAPSFQKVFDQALPRWRTDNLWRCATRSIFPRKRLPPRTRCRSGPCSTKSRRGP